MQKGDHVLDRTLTALERRALLAKVVLPRFGQALCSRERQPYLISASLLCTMSAGVNDKNASERLGCHGKEVCTALPVQLLFTRKYSQVEFVHHSCRLQSVVGSLSLEAVARQPTQIAVEQCHQLIAS